MQFENNKLNDDVIGVIEGYLSNTDRFNQLRTKYSNEYLTSGLKHKNDSQLQLIFMKMIEMIEKDKCSSLCVLHKDECSSLCVLFNTVGIAKNTLDNLKKNDKLKKKHEINKEYYETLWKSWYKHQTKDEKIKKIIDIFQRYCDIVNRKNIEYLFPTIKDGIKIEEGILLPEEQSIYTEKITKFLLLLVSILKNPPINSKKRKFEHKKIIQEKYYKPVEYKKNIYRNLCQIIPIKRSTYDDHGDMFYFRRTRIIPYLDFDFIHI
jgi:hypothetical protein